MFAASLLCVLLRIVEWIVLTFLALDCPTIKTHHSVAFVKKLLALRGFTFCKIKFTMKHPVDNKGLTRRDEYMFTSTYRCRHEAFNALCYMEETHRGDRG